MNDYDEVRYAIYNRLDALPQLQREAIIKRLSWFERIVKQRERSRIIFLLRQGHSNKEFTKAWIFMADYLESLNRDQKLQTEEESILNDND